MKNSKITRKITQGMYVLTTAGGGCVVDAVARVGGSDQPLIAVSVAKSNKTNELLHENAKFALSVLGEDANPALIQTFGFKSSRDIDKLTEHDTEEIEGVQIIKESLGYMVLEKVDAIENETHTLFIGKMVEGDVFQPDGQPMTYSYYQENKSALAAQESKEDLTKATSEQGKTAWVCTVCGYVYYGDEVPDDYRCPLCGLGKAYFKKKED